jgi:hypothetical protein
MDLGNYRGYDIETFSVTRPDGSEETAGLIARWQHVNPVRYEVNGAGTGDGDFFFDPVEAGRKHLALDTLQEQIKQQIDEQHRAFSMKAGYEINPDTLPQR